MQEFQTCSERRLLRIALVAFSCILLTLGAAQAEDNPESSKNAVRKMTGEERTAALKRAVELDARRATLEVDGKYGSAIPPARSALRLLDAALGPRNVLVIQAQGKLAALLFRHGAYVEAQQFYERLLALLESLLGPEDPQAATALLSLALVREALGAHGDAHALQLRALTLFEKAYSPDHATVAVCLNNLAKSLQVLGAFEEARPLYERALRIMESTGGSKHLDFAVILNNLASLFDELGAPQEARRLHERALQVMERTLGADHPTVAMSLNNLALTLRRLGAHAEAGRLMERALKIDEAALGPDHPAVARDLGNVAGLLLDRGAYEEALPLLKRGIKIRERALGSDHPSLVGSLSNLAWLYKVTEHYDQAGSLLARCVNIVEHHFRSNVSGLRASERLALVRSLHFSLSNLLEVVEHLDRTGYEEVLRCKGLLTRVVTAERRLARIGGAKSAMRVRELQASERRVAKLASTVPSFRRKASMAAWREAYARAAAERETLALGLAKDFAPLRQGLERLDLKLSDIQAALTEHSVLVDYLRTGNGYTAWVVSHHGAVQRIDLGKAGPIEAAAAVFGDRVAASSSASWMKAGRALRKLTLEPIEAHIGKAVTTLHICPDAALAAVPFGALPGSKNGRFLGEIYTVSSISMAQDLVPWKHAVAPGRGALLLGGVDYGVATASKTGVRPRASVDRAPSGGIYPFLPGTRAEIKAILPRFGANAAAALGADATEAFVRSASGGKRVLHLATHGFVRADLMRGLTRRQADRKWLGASMERQLAVGHDPLNLSGLVLAGANRRRGGGDDDGILTALEASHLRLDGVELVVLSACHTALGTAESGEGVVGLVRGFQMAGAKRVIGSLWAVDDAATMALMSRFYTLWAPGGGRPRTPAAVALKLAQEHVRSQAKWSHPHYWAAWIVWGSAD